MNKNLRFALNSIATGVGRVISNVCQGFVSCLRMIVLSKISYAFRSVNYSKLKTNQNCCILANGPSLKKALDAGGVSTDGCDVFCVNMFCQSEYFYKIQPKFYFLIDEEYFNPSNDFTKGQVKFLTEALNKVDWTMYLMISSSSTNGGLLKGLSNTHIKVVRWNTTTVEGGKHFRNICYSLRLGMPKCQTVTNFALVAAVNMAYGKVYLYGADHSWTKDLMVNDDNQTCYGDRHVYDTNVSYRTLDCSVASLLRDFANMFETHWHIEGYSKHKGVKIINCTKGSFVDAYERQKVGADSK